MIKYKLIEHVIITFILSWLASVGVLVLYVALLGYNIWIGLAGVNLITMMIVYMTMYK
ncbi:hypothetical protein LCGC14_0577010 [marine sediment metagenome]|uniref:Uncharacterized protein n=1 Tax=marine sediment metagenome TaxID=412755 RepID=A0A0F9RMI8_9ZZZZ